MWQNKWGWNERDPILRACWSAMDRTLCLSNTSTECYRIGKLLAARETQISIGDIFIYSPKSELPLATRQIWGQSLSMGDYALRKQKWRHVTILHISVKSDQKKSFIYIVGRNIVFLCWFFWLFLQVRAVSNLELSFSQLGKDYYHPRTRYPPARRQEVTAYRSLPAWGSQISHVKFWIFSQSFT